MSTQQILNIDSLKEQIPYYLTSEQKKGLSKALNDFPKGTNYYLGNCSDDIKNSMLQGDIFKELTIFGERGRKEVKGIILSNSCDIDCSNQRDFPAKALFAPLIDLARYKDALLRSGKPQESVDEKINSIIEQRITNIVYLPAIGQMPDSIVLLDDIYQLKATQLEELLKSDNKQFTLSQVGFYILLFKLSLHFCRFHENVARYDS